MASIKISGLTEQTTASDTDLLPVASSAGMAKRMTLANFVTWLASKLNSKFAPTGYGLGENTTETVDLNEETACGWKAFTKASLNTPFDYGLVLTMNRYGNQITQIAFNPYMGGCGEICIRHKYDDVWREWEYVNPPMLLGVEYRTTERWNGKPIYVTLVNFGALPNASIKTIISQIAFSEIVGVEGMVSSGGGANPISNMNGLDDIWIHGGTQMNINVMTSTDLSEKTMTLIVKYTKD